MAFKSYSLVALDLQEEYSAGRLERSYLFYTQDERREWREMQESCQSMKAWSFGKEV